MNRLLIFICLLLTACSSQPTDKYSEQEGSWQEFSARDNDLTFARPLIYRAFVPVHWTKFEAHQQDSIKDTTKPICEFRIQDSEDEICITIHTFPFQDATTRIPNSAQIDRWKNQLEALDTVLTQISYDSHAGFFGMKLEAQNQVCKVLAWSMQLASEHEKQIRLSSQSDSYKLADYTIKAIGTPFLIEKHQADIQRFANSFEFIDELQTVL